MTHFDDDVALDRALDPLVLALDIGSTATRGGVHDASGRRVHGLQHKVPHAFTVAPDGTSVIDPDQVTAEVEQVLDAVTGDPRLGTRIAGVAMDTFAASLIGVDAAGRALTPCFTYADSRSSAAVTALREQLDEHTVQQRTGTRLHTSYHAPRLRWLAGTQPRLVAQATAWWSLGEYVFARLIGQPLAGTSTVAWTGLLDRRTGALDAELLAAAGLEPGQLSPPRDMDQPAPATAGRPALARAVWFPVITDGFASNIGSGATDATVLTAATATSGALRVLLDGPADPLPFGLWNYRVAADRTLLGGAINDVGRAVSWAQSTLRLSPGIAAALTAAPSDATPLVLPYLTGERAPGWAGGARAVFGGVTAATDADSLFRGMVEGVAMTYARVADELRPAASQIIEVAAAGRVSNDLPEWLQVLADVLGRPVTHVTRRRATQRGTALLALDVLAPGVPRAPRATGATYEPRSAHAEHYAVRRERFAEAYEVLVKP
ncbi:putative FGGY-family carbohydrate kinase [Actinoplanes missouriensis 431]|uniref:Putative FGGY-family carbohydrate kinase n=1 Tax=Actinoplanes missouriensis (strain ATCC 14538 / DSM 43046 / CBS 188.64 / JCM 3121 / NBRC 102363 / NCIMB 12654 / NRRL B-3342 / UNCC 431) TaxID=512565 RepID=I0HDZ9_ACTM4|nr:gluconokinase [Actinoplanes missouriensis]BAL91236.1 putative FGGY-family carbohydrate kinase [Actinoplanes missouriensis 431]